MAVNHSTDSVCGSLVLLLASLLVPVQEVVADAVVIKTVARGIEADDSAILRHDEAIDARAVPLKQLIVACAGDDSFVACVYGGAAVPPILLFLLVVDNPRLSHALGIWFCDAICAV
jgi:hypothetical protein